jgi:hypothetical protein
VANKPELPESTDVTAERFQRRVAALWKWFRGDQFGLTAALFLLTPTKSKKAR